MNNAHTPAPWFFEFGKIFATKPVALAAPRSVVIATIGKISAGENQANAQLIAAAPAMLEALERARDRLQLAMSTSPATGGETWLSDIDKIINQALGE